MFIEQEKSHSQMFEERTLPTGKVLLAENSGQVIQKHSAHHALPSHLSTVPVNYDRQVASSTHHQPVPSQPVVSLDSFLDDYDSNYGWTDEDSDYLTSHSFSNPENQWSAHTSSDAHYSRDASCSGNDLQSPPSCGSEVQSAPYGSNAPLPNSHSNVNSRTRCSSPQASSGTIPPLPFSTPPKLRTVEQVLISNPGQDEAALRKLTTALAREAIFGRDELAKKSLTGRTGTEELDKQKIDYIKSIVRSRVPKKSDVEFESIWKWCRRSLSKSCQTLRTTAKNKNKLY